MKKFCAILFSFVLIVVLALPVAAEGRVARWRIPPRR